jgi:four helix bundle protein
MARNFRKILAWQKDDNLVVEIYRATHSHFPDQERYGLTSQIRSAAVSVPANIAEGSGRESLIDFRRFLFVSQGSLSEVEYYLHLAYRLEYLDKPCYEKLETLRGEVVEY